MKKLAITAATIGIFLLATGCSGSESPNEDPDLKTQDEQCTNCDTPDSAPETVPEEDTGADCSAVCLGLECGDLEGCQCGTCEDSAVGNNGLCEVPEPDCETICQEAECGQKGQCQCGDCEAPDTCVDNLCQPCTTDCSDKVCGPDGCGGTCGDCDTGQCNGATGQCVQCFPEGQEPQFSDVVHKTNHLAIGEGGTPGFALDVDQDPATCAPLNNCQDGLDNAIGGLLDQVGQFVDVNAELGKALEEGSIMLLMESVGANTTGQDFTINIYLGEAAVDKETCDWQSETCEYLVDPSSFDLDQCTPIIFFDNATITDGHLSAGGPEAIFSVTIPLDSGLVLTANAYMARIEGTVQLEGETITAITDAIIGGAVHKQELIDTCLALPADTFTDLPISKEMICNLLDMFIVADIDIDGDGMLDSASIGIALEAIGATIAGLQPEA